MEFLGIDPEKLEHSWSAIIKQKNGQEVKIWYTAYPMHKIIIESFVSIASDYPKHIIKPS